MSRARHRARLKEVCFFTAAKLACFRLQDSGGKSEEKTRARKRAGAGERQDHRPLFPQAPARVLFSRSLSVRADPLSESLEQATAKRTTGADFSP